MTTTTERKHLGFPKMMVDTPFGMMECWATSDRHIGLQANGPRNVEDRQTIKVNGIEYTVRYDFAPTAEVLAGSRPWDGRDAEGLDWAVSYEGSMSRVDNWKDASAAARRKVRAWALAWVNDFAKTEEGKALILTAQRHKVSNDIMNAEADLIKAREAVQEIEARIANLRTQEAGL